MIERTAAAVVTAVLLATGLSHAYSLKDAAYVTTSRDEAVLAYVACLEASVANSPKAEPVQISLEIARRACQQAERKLPRSENEPTGDDVRAMILECGFRPGDASPDASCD